MVLCCIRHSVCDEHRVLHIPPPSHPGPAPSLPQESEAILFATVCTSIDNTEPGYNGIQSKVNVLFVVCIARGKRQTKWSTETYSVPTFQTNTARVTSRKTVQAAGREFSKFEAKGSINILSEIQPRSQDLRRLCRV